MHTHLKAVRVSEDGRVAHIDGLAGFWQRVKQLTGGEHNYAFERCRPNEKMLLIKV